MDEQIGQANIVISSVATPDYLYTRESFERTVEKRRAGSLLIIDVGVPRNFDPAINKIEDVYLYSMDELKEVAEQNLKAREEDVTSGLEIVYAQAAEFMDWFRAKDIGPLIGRMKDEFRQISRKELERFLVGTPAERLLPGPVGRDGRPRGQQAAALRDQERQHRGERGRSDRGGQAGRYDPAAGP